MMGQRSVWPEVPLKKVLAYFDKRVKLEDMKEYITITVKRRHGGLEERERLMGHQIQTKKQFQLNPGAFIISRVQCWHQAFAIVPSNLPSNMIASSNYDQFSISPEIDSRFFWWLSHSPMFTETVRSSASGVVIEKMVFNRESWLNKTIPLPSLSEQRRIVARIEELTANIEEAKGLRKESLEEAEALVDQVATSIFQSPTVRSYLKPIALADLHLNRESRDPARSNPGGKFAYVDISSVSQGPSVVSSGKVLPSNEAPSRARRVIHTDDIIMSTVRPNLRAFAKIGRELDNQICSTGFAVFSCGPSLNPDFLLLQMCSPFFVEQCVAKTTGGHYPAINDTNLKKVNIISPPLPEQRHIVAQLDALQAKVDGLKKLQDETAEELEALLPSVLDRAFKGEL